MYMYGVQYRDAKHAKTDQHCRAEDCFAIDDLVQEFIDKAVLSFRKRLRFCVAAAGRYVKQSV